MGMLHENRRVGDALDKREATKLEKVSVNGIAIFLLEAQDAAWLASYQWNIRARFITS